MLQKNESWQAVQDLQISCGELQKKKLQLRSNIEFRYKFRATTLAYCLILIWLIEERSAYMQNKYVRLCIGVRTDMYKYKHQVCRQLSIHSPRRHLIMQLPAVRSKDFCCHCLAALASLFSAFSFQTSPPTKNSFFQTGTVALSSSIAQAHAYIAACF